MSGTKVCCSCHQEKPLSEFRSRRSRCKVCDKEERRRINTFISELKSKPCTDCGQMYHPFVMDFDHIDGYVKKIDVSKLSKQRVSMAAVKKEIGKCQLVCANCHRIRTLKRIQEKSNENPKNKMPQD